MNRTAQNKIHAAAFRERTIRADKARNLAVDALAAAEDALRLSAMSAYAVVELALDENDYVKAEAAQITQQDIHYQLQAIMQALKVL